MFKIPDRYIYIINASAVDIFGFTKKKCKKVSRTFRASIMMMS